MTVPSLLLLLSFCFLLCLTWLWHLDWAHHDLYWLLGSSVQKNRHIEAEKDLLPLLVNTRGWVYNQMASLAYSCSNDDILMGWRSCFYGSCFSLSPAAEASLLGYALLSLCLLDETAQDLLAACDSHRFWQKQVRDHRGKRSFTPTTHRSQARGETANVHQDRPHTPRPAGQAGSYLAAGPLDRATRHPTALASGALPHALETQVKGLFPQAKDSPRNHCLDQADGEGESTLGC